MYTHTRTHTHYTYIFHIYSVYVCVRVCVHIKHFQIYVSVTKFEMFYDIYWVFEFPSSKSIFYSFSHLCHQSIDSAKFVNVMLKLFAALRPHHHQYTQFHYLRFCWHKTHDRNESNRQLAWLLPPLGRAWVFKVWSRYQQHGRHQGICEKCRFPVVSPHLLNRRIWAWRRGICVLWSPPGDSHTHGDVPFENHYSQPISCPVSAWDIIKETKVNSLCAHFWKRNVVMW